MMLRIFSSNYIVAAVAMMAIIHANNGGVYAESGNDILASFDEAINVANTTEEVEAAQAKETAELNNTDDKVEVSSASLLMSSMMGMAAVTIAVVAMA